jgi:glycosyltransferase involved in cell wall biosynthesis
VLYSFAYGIGGERIATTAWHQVDGATRAGAQVTVLAGSLTKPFPKPVTVRTTLSLGRRSLPIRRLFGRRWLGMLHDLRTARWLDAHASSIDVVHTWPLASLQTSLVARRHRIPVLLERPNAHTAFAYQAVADESRRLGVVLGRGAEHRFDGPALAREEAEYRAADYLLCPSPFVARTFFDRGFPAAKLLRHQYGYDEDKFYPGADPEPERGLVVLYAGIGTPRKGLHHALEAWIASGVHHQGSFLICGRLLPEYQARLAPLLSHPSVRLLGQQSDLGSIMREADVFVLPTVEEGSALVTYEARACGCVLAVSEAAGAVCEHEENALLHPVGDVRTLAEQLARLQRDRDLLRRLRHASLATADQLTWTAAGKRLVEVYREAITRHASVPRLPADHGVAA